MTVTARHRKEKIKLVEKEKRKKTAEELIEKSKKAFNSKLIVEIVGKAPANKDGKVSLTKAYDQVFEHVFEQTKDLKTAKEFAVAGRWLAMLKRDYSEEFARITVSTVTILPAEKCVASIDELKAQQKPEPKKYFGQIEFEISSSVVAVTKEDERSKRRFLMFPYAKHAQEFCLKIINNFLELDTREVNEEVWKEYRKFFIQILEEKFGLKIKVCGYCYCYSAYGLLPAYRDIGCGACEKCCSPIKRAFGEKCGFEISEWKPKEIPEEKKEEEKTCGNCGYADCSGLRVPCGNWIPMEKKEEDK